jgi:hypothetical protein
MWGALFDKRTDLSFTIAAGPGQRRNFWIPESRGTHGHVLLSQVPDYINLEGQYRRIYIPQELSSLFVASCTVRAGNTTSSSFCIVAWERCLAMALVLLLAYEAVA